MGKVPGREGVYRVNYALLTVMSMKETVYSDLQSDDGDVRCMPPIYPKKTNIGTVSQVTSRKLLKHGVVRVWEVVRVCERIDIILNYHALN